jgi:hypothetical protein
MKIASFYIFASIVSRKNMKKPCAASLLQKVKAKTPGCVR